MFLWKMLVHGKEDPISASARNKAAASPFYLKDRAQHLHRDVEQPGVRRAGRG